VVAGIALLIGVGTASASALPRWRGIQLDVTNTSELSQAHQLGANAVEVFAEWQDLQPSPGGYSQAALTGLDQQVHSAAFFGMKVILIVRDTPCWDSSEPARAKQYQPARCPAFPPYHPQDYGNVVRFLTDRYAGMLAAVEVWDEEDHADGQHFAAPNPAAAYAQLLKAAHAAVQASSAPVPVLVGALVGANGAFLRALYRHGVKGSYSGVAVDYYNLVLASVRAIHQVQLAHGDHTPLWLGEFGWETCVPHPSADERYYVCVSPQQQAQNFDDIFRALKGHAWIRGMIAFVLRDSTDLHFGITDVDGNPKPAFGQIAHDWGAATLPPPRPVRLHQQGRRLVGTAPVGDVIELTVGPRHGAAVYQPTLVVNPNGKFSWPLPGGVRGGWIAQAVEPWTHGSARLALR